MTKPKKFPHTRHVKVMNKIALEGGHVEHLMRGDRMPSIYMAGCLELPVVTVQELIAHRRLLPLDEGLLADAAQTYVLVKAPRAVKGP